ncbi:biotin biosynthesis protein BioY [Sphaerisporangium krabiense]|uniref:Biotin transporter n=1 Tax=Sphaerisporangium krabiense TaxID=763782 RepID=A0A7W8Z4Y3_9ACTN|nr:biotin transporter BioY [Sphaerisporangium krabiense]MBB5627537.1 biotin transport system substrate-specific component [Sphaerisporangium krabiense]GII66551.1 biotin biosynthesis protein BioY [Sphaerisporangium krabiense]
MSDASVAVRPAVLSDLVPAVPSKLVRDIALVVGAAGLVGVAAQVSIPLPGTPVPLTLQTFAVLLSGAALGLPRAFAAMALYLVIGQLGVPWFAPGGDNATLGYVVGFVLAASVAGALSRRGGDRTPMRTVATMTFSTVLIYAIGVPWLMVVKSMDLPTAFDAGVVPFLIGDGLKVLAAAALLPGAWKLLDR